MGFIIVCTECKSTNVSVIGDMDCVAYMKCNNCGQIQYSDEFQPDKEKDGD